MPRAYICFIALSTAMAANGLSAPEITPRAVIEQRGQDCPYLSVSHKDSSTSIQGCCIGGSDAGQTPFLSVCQGWPICGSNPTTTTWTATPISCAAMIAFTDANYDAELSSAKEAFSADSTNFCYTVGGSDSCAGGSPATATTTSDASSATDSGGDSGNGSDGANGGDAAATGGDAAATGGNSVGSAGSAGSAVNSGNAASNTGTSQSGSSGSSSSSNSGSSGSSSSSSNTTGSSSSGSSSSSTTTTTSTSGESGANALGLGWGAWALGLAGVGPVVMAVML